MKTRHEIEIRMSEIREALNADDAPENADALKTEYRSLEGEFREVVKAEQEAQNRQRANDNPEGDTTGEGAEFRALMDRIEIRNYLVPAAAGSRLGGAEAELNQALKIGDSGSVVLPWEVLLPEQRQTEHRADAATDLAADIGPRVQQSIVGRVFADSSAAYLGVAMPTVGVGEQQYIALTAGTAAEQKAKGASVDAKEATFTPKALTPLRLSARYLFSIEDAARLRGMESALRSDLRAAMRDALDVQVISGSGDASSVAGFLADPAKGGLPAEADPGAAIAFGGVTGLFAGQVDGLYSKTVNDVRMLIGEGSYQHIIGLQSNGIFIADRFRNQFQVTANTPDAANSVEEGIAFKTARPTGNAVAPIWQGIQLIRDPYSAAASGQISLTAVMLWNFAILRAAAYDRVKVKFA